MKSIIQTDGKGCYLCGKTVDLECHHVFGGVANRRISEKYGLKVWLCAGCHRGTDGAQYNKEINVRLKQEAQKAFVNEHGLKMWMDLFRKNYTGDWSE